MFTDAIFFILLLALEIILWGIPKTRKPNGNWLIALKTVPVGFVIWDIVAKLFRMLLFALSEWKMQEVTISSSFINLTGFILSLSVIILSGIFIKRRWGTEKKYNPLPSIIIFLFSVIPVCILYACLSWIVDFNTGNYQSEWRIRWIDLDSQKIAFEEQPIHPFLAEYNYRIRFVGNGKSIRQQLFCNYGGRTHFNIYRLKDGQFLFRDKDWDYLVNLSRREISILTAFEDKLYAAMMPDEHKGIGFWRGPYKKDNTVFFDFNDHQVPAMDVTGILEGMKYYGSIRDKYYSAAEESEKQIEFMQKR